MTTVICNFIGVDSRPVEGVVRLSTKTPHPGTRGMVVPSCMETAIKDGAARFDSVQPGEVEIALTPPSTATCSSYASWQVTVPDTEEITLVELVAGVEWTPPHVSELQSSLAEARALLSKLPGAAEVDERLGVVESKIAQLGGSGGEWVELEAVWPRIYSGGVAAPGELRSIDFDELPGYEVYHEDFSAVAAVDDTRVYFSGIPMMNFEERDKELYLEPEEDGEFRNTRFALVYDFSEGNPRAKELFGNYAGTAPIVSNGAPGMAHFIGSRLAIDWDANDLLKQPYFLAMYGWQVTFPRLRHPRPKLWRG